jgi:hypothetical protein
MGKRPNDDGAVQGDGGLREISGVFIINDLSKRISNLEANQQETLPLVGKMEAAFTTFANIGEDIKEIKNDVKGVVSNQGQIYLQLVTFDGRVKCLEEMKATALQHRDDRRKAVRTAVLSITATVIGAAIIWLFGLR